MLQTVLFVAAAIAVVVGVFIAWWIAVCAVLCFAGYLWVMRFLNAKGLVNGAAGSAASGNGPVVIEGQYQVEPEPGTPSQGQGAGRIIDAASYREER